MVCRFPGLNAESFYYQIFIIPTAPIKFSMNQILPQVGLIRHKMGLFDLKVTYQPPLDSASNDEDEKLDIYLKINSKSGKQVYRTIFTNESIPNETISIFSGLDIIFECFREQNGFEIDFKTGKILLKGIFEIKGRKIEKKSIISLETYEISLYEAMAQQIQQLQAEVFQIRSKKQQRDEKLKKEYEKRFQEEKRKLEQALNLSKEEEEQRQRKQKIMETYISQLESKLTEFTNKISSFQKTNLRQIQELRNRSELCQNEIKTAQEEFENTYLFKSGRQGRKMRKVNQIVPIERPINRARINRISSSRPKGRLSRPKPLPPNIPQVVDENSLNIRKFEYEGNKITYIGKGQTSLVMKIDIPKTPFMFGLRILKTLLGGVLVGVAQKSSFLDEPFCSKQTKSIGYCGRSTYIWGADKLVDVRQFKTGDLVQVYVELEMPYIEWRVNGQVIASCDPAFFITDNSSTFVPFIEMETRGDCIEWIPQ